MATSFESHNFVISNQWDGSPIDHVPIMLSISKDPSDASSLRLETESPFFNDPGKPPGEPGKPFQPLWDYEVVEAFFLGDDEKYLEVEVGPHGQHLVLTLTGVGKIHKIELPMEYQCTIDPTEKTWKGYAKIPMDYFPPGVRLFNAFAMHGSGDERMYEALYHVPKDKFPKPNFHRLEYFKEVDFKDLITPTTMSSSIAWEGAV